MRSYHFFFTLTIQGPEVNVFQFPGSVWLLKLTIFIKIIPNILLNFSSYFQVFKIRPLSLFSLLGEESRITHRDDISRVLQSFGECEAYLDKSSKCLQDVEAKINSHFDDEPRELIEQKALHNEIAEIIKIIDGKERRG